MIESEKFLQSSETSKPTRREFLKRGSKGLVGMAISLGVLSELVEAEQGRGERKEQADHEIREQWQEYKRMVRISNVRENIKILEEQFGEDNDLVKKVKNDLGIFDFIVETENKGIDILSSEGYIRVSFLSLFRDIKLFWDVDTLRRVASEAYRANSKRPNVRGFNVIKGLDNKEVQQILEAQFDHRWLYGNTATFEFVNQDKKKGNFQIGGTAFNEGLYGVMTRSGKEKIELYKGMEDLGQILEGVAHELGHQHDWENSNTLNIPERLNLLVQVLNRLNAEDRVREEYIETITPDIRKDMPPKEIKYRQALEYWAEIVRHFYSDPTAFKEKHPADYEIVKGWRDLILSRYETR